MGSGLYALLISGGLVVVGNALTTTLLALGGERAGLSSEAVGFVMSAFFAGYVLSSIVVPPLVCHRDHVRVFAALAALVSVVVLLYPEATAAWGLLRLLHGVGHAGLLIVVESWLNARAVGRERGRVLASYNVVLLLAWTAGPALVLSLEDGYGLEAFVLASIAISLSILPITLAGITMPAPSRPGRMGPSRLVEISPTATAGVLVLGAVVHAFMSMGPVYARETGLPAGVSASFVSVVTLGALFTQWPLGWLSDRVDRRKVLVGASLLAASACFVGLFGSSWGVGLTLFAAFAFGAFTIPLYSVAVAHLNDRLGAEELVSGASSLVLVYGLGATAGPWAASLLMGAVGPGGLFVFSASALLGFVVLSIVRVARVAPVRAFAKEPYVAVPRTTHAALGLHAVRGSEPVAPARPAEHPVSPRSSG